MLAMRGVSLSYETVREWCLKFGQTYANGLRHRSSRPGDRWHLDIRLASDEMGQWPREGVPTKWVFSILTRLTNSYGPTRSMSLIHWWFAE